MSSVEINRYCGRDTNTSPLFRDDVIPIVAAFQYPFMYHTSWYSPSIYSFGEPKAV
jgi:hypothetical protein